MFKNSKNPRVEELTKSHRERSIHLGELKPIRIEIPGNKPDRFCCWCTEGKLHSNAQKYCSEICRDSATAWAYPQKEEGLKFLLMRQDWKCAKCQFDYRPTMDAVMERARQMGRDSSTIFWYHLKYLKNRVSSERKPEVDHIVPIFKGGASIGLSNHQAICNLCHKMKTIKDLSKKD